MCMIMKRIKNSVSLPRTKGRRTDEIVTNITYWVMHTGLKKNNGVKQRWFLKSMASGLLREGGKRSEVIREIWEESMSRSPVRVSVSHRIYTIRIKMAAQSENLKYWPNLMQTQWVAKHVQRGYYELRYWIWLLALVGAVLFSSVHFRLWHV